MFEKPNPKLARQILDFKRDVASLRQVVLPQRDAVGRLARREFPLISEQLAYRFRDVHDHLVRLSDEAMFFQDRISGILDAHLSAVSNQLNAVMKVLTLISTIFLPLTVLTGMYGMNVTLPHMPGGDPWQFWWVVGHHGRRCRAACCCTSASGGGLSERIHRLPLHLANQIAAGEVVERPASVVKELVENALDAGVDADRGGDRARRQEADSGRRRRRRAWSRPTRSSRSSGTRPARFATPDDLGAIRTLGFRGEALPSIASVSHFVLRTPRARRGERHRGAHRRRPARVGARGRHPRRHLHRGRRSVLQPAGPPQVPQVRRRRSHAGLAADHAAGARLRGDRLVADLGRPPKLLECPPAAGLPERFFQLFGDRPDLLQLRKDAAGISIHGYVAALGDHGPVRGPQNVFVNRRIVKDRTIAHAISEAYSVATIKERSPEVHLFIEIPPDRVDVNVHPTKAEVRFLEQSLVHEVLRRALADALGRGPAPELQLTPFHGRLG